MKKNLFRILITSILLVAVLCSCDLFSPKNEEKVIETTKTEIEYRDNGFVCAIGDKQFTTLQAAIDSLNPNLKGAEGTLPIATIKLICDANGDGFTIDFPANITIDFGKHSYCLTGSKGFEFTDRSGAGNTKIQAGKILIGSSTKFENVIFVNGSSVSVNDIKVDGTDNNKVSMQYGTLLIENSEITKGSMSIDDGEATVKGSVLDLNKFESKGTVILANTNLDGDVAVNGGSMQVTKSTINADTFSSKGTTTIANSSVNGKIAVNSGVMNIIGSIINANELTKSDTATLHVKDNSMVTVKDEASLIVLQNANDGSTTIHRADVQEDHVWKFVPENSVEPTFVVPGYQYYECACGETRKLPVDSLLGTKTKDGTVDYSDTHEEYIGDMSEDLFNKLGLFEDECREAFDKITNILSGSYHRVNESMGGNIIVHPTLNYFDNSTGCYCDYYKYQINNLDVLAKYRFYPEGDSNYDPEPIKVYLDDDDDIIKVDIHYELTDRANTKDERVFNVTTTLSFVSDHFEYEGSKIHAYKKGDTAYYPDGPDGFDESEALSLSNCWEDVALHMLLNSKIDAESFTVTLRTNGSTKDLITADGTILLKCNDIYSNYSDNSLREIELEDLEITLSDFTLRADINGSQIKLDVPSTFHTGIDLMYNYAGSTGGYNLAVELDGNLLASLTSANTKLSLDAGFKNSKLSGELKLSSAKIGLELELESDSTQLGLTLNDSKLSTKSKDFIFNITGEVPMSLNTVNLKTSTYGKFGCDFVYGKNKINLTSAFDFENGCNLGFKLTSRNSLADILSGSTPQIEKITIEHSGIFNADVNLGVEKLSSGSSEYKYSAGLSIGSDNLEFKFVYDENINDFLKKLDTTYCTIGSFKLQLGSDSLAWDSIMNSFLGLWSTDELITQQEINPAE